MLYGVRGLIKMNKHNKLVVVKKDIKHSHKENELVEMKQLLKELAKSTKNIEKTLGKMADDNNSDWLPKAYI